MTVVNAGAAARVTLTSSVENLSARRIGALEIRVYFLVLQSASGFSTTPLASSPTKYFKDSFTKKYTLVSRAPILKTDAFSTLDVNINRAAAPALTTVTVTAKYRYRFALPVMSGLVDTINTGLTFKFVAP